VDVCLFFLVHAEKKEFFLKGKKDTPGQEVGGHVASLRGKFF
jgi:hypothetical protein